MFKARNKDRDSNDYRTYKDYISVGNVQTKPYLMISELIDNAIGSMDNNLVGGKWSKMLEINIQIDLSSKDKSIINTMEVYSDNYIRVTDNAFGMTDDRLFKALKLNSEQDDESSKMNVHGRGLKQSAFYFGTDLEVNTYNGEESSKMKIKLSEQESINSRIQFNTEDSDFETLGTEVIISKIKRKSKFTPNSFKKKVLPALGQRYKKFLDRDLIRINYEVSFPMGQDNLEGFVSADVEPMDKVATVFRMEKLQGIIDESRKQLDKKIKTDDTTFVDVDLTNATFSAIENTLKQAMEDNNQDFIFELPISLNDHEINAKFWMLKKNNAQFRGFRVYEGIRAILHGPITKDGTSTYLSWYAQAVRTGSTINRFAGEFDISVANVKTKTDKSSFDISEEAKEKLDAQLLIVWNVFDIFVMQGRKEDNNEEGFGTSDAEAQRLESLIKTKYKGETVSYVNYNKKKDLLEVDINTSGESWSFEIVINKSLGPNKIFDSNINDDDKRYRITAFTGHKFWKRIDKLSKTNFVTELVHPLCILMGMQELEIRIASGKDIGSTSKFNEGGIAIFEDTDE